MVFLTVRGQFGNLFGVNIGDILAGVVFIVASFTDAADGYIARKHGIVTNLGKFIDPLADKILVVAALISLVELGRLDAWIVVIIVSREFIVSGIRMVAKNIIAVFSGMGAVFAVDKDGKLWTWGNNDYYGLGTGKGGHVNVATPVAGGESGTVQLGDIVEVEISYLSVIALKANGTVFTWGTSEAGLGNGVVTSSASPVQVLKGVGPSPVSDKFIENVVDIAVGEGYYANDYWTKIYKAVYGVLTEDGSVYYWSHCSLLRSGRRE